MKILKFYRLFSVATLGLLSSISSVLSAEEHKPDPLDTPPPYEASTMAPPPYETSIMGEHKGLAAGEDFVQITADEALKIKGKINQAIDELNTSKAWILNKPQYLDVNLLEQYIYNIVTHVFGMGALHSLDVFKIKLPKYHSYGGGPRIHDYQISELEEHKAERPAGKVAFTHLPHMVTWYNSYKDLVIHDYKYGHAISLGIDPKKLNPSPYQTVMQVFEELKEGIEAMLPSPKDVKAGGRLPEWQKNWLMENGE